MRTRDPLEVLTLHQFPEQGGGCTGDCGWGLAVDAGTDNEQMARHQIDMLEEQGFRITR